MLNPGVPAGQLPIVPGFDHIFVSRSGWLYCTPVSTTATTTAFAPADPVVRFQADTACSSAPAVPVTPFTVWPVF